MCYSAMVEQDAKKLAAQFKAKVQTDQYAQLFQRRLAGEKLMLNSDLEATFLKSSTSMQEKAIAKDIRQWHEKQIEKLQDDLTVQEERKQKAQLGLEIKQTKKNSEELRISTSKIERIKKDIQKHSDFEQKSDARIFPKHYASVVVAGENQEKLVMPMRYLFRPSNETEDFDETHGGCYNARFDSLSRVPFWRKAFEEGRRGVFVVRKFYENVDSKTYALRQKKSWDPKQGQNLVICFEPKGLQEMHIPVLWDCWKKNGEELFSFALITDEPSKEVASAGHDRCPIFLQETAIEQWLFGKADKSLAAKEFFLSDREKPFYEHRVLQSAS